MSQRTTRWDVADHLQSAEDIAAYLEAVLEADDPILLSAAIEDVRRALRNSDPTKR